jgi:gentisate 1,2-dioxygenase
MATETLTKNVDAEVQELMNDLATTNTKPLWAQMTKLNPPLPNPTCVPHVWNYDEIRPQLLKAGELITEKQAERRVLMLVNPARGEYFCFRKGINY